MKTKKITVSALMLAIATVLSLIKLYELPFGGTVTVASMVPVVIISYIYGTKWGLFSAFVYSILQLVLGIAGGIVSKMFLPGDEQMILWQALVICLFDYIFAATVLGFGGIFKNKLTHRVTEIVLGSILAVTLCWLMHTISGAIFYGSWAEWFFGDATGLSQLAFTKPFCDWVLSHMSGVTLSIFYSVIYNAAYMLPEAVITALVAPFIYKSIQKTNII